MARKKKRIEVGGAPVSLNNAFGGIHLEGLAPGPEMPQTASSAPRKQKNPGSLCLRRETAHRGGKSVVVVYDFPRTQSSDAIKSLARELKQHCGCGGTVKNREIQIQGEKAAQVRAFLQERGYRMRGVTS